MDKTIDKELISDNNLNPGQRSSVSKNIKSDMSQNSLLSSNVDRKVKDRKNGTLKRLNSISERNLNKQIKKQLEDDSFFSSKNNQSKNDIKKSQKINNSKDKNNNMDKIIVDNIENIYLNLSHLPNKLFWQKFLIFLIVFFVSSLHWVFLFLTKRKMERDYCFTKLNQFESCIPEQFCSEKCISKINYHLYNDSFGVHNNSLGSHKNFLEELKSINEYYKNFFINLNYQISKEGLLFALDTSQKNTDKYSFVIILTKKEKWNIFLDLYSYCNKDAYYFYIVGMILLGGLIGSFLFGTLADIYGRKILIIITLFIVTISLIFITAIAFTIEKKYDFYLDNFNKYYISNTNFTNYDILSKLYAQTNTNLLFRTFGMRFLISLFLLNLALRPLLKISLSLLLENSTSELIILKNLRLFTFITTGLPPFIVAQVLIVINNSVALLLFLSLSFLILLILSFFLLTESMRHLYEYCEWKELTKVIFSLYQINDDVHINFKNKIEFQAFLLDENRQLFDNIFQKFEPIKSGAIKKTEYNLAKRRIISIKRNIKRNSILIIKKYEIKFNPLILYSCINANAELMNSKYLIIIILFILYLQEYFIEKEILEIPFVGLSDFYINKDDNFIINSNLFILGIIIYLSNYFYYFFYRISCFKMILYISIIIILILLIFHYFITYKSDDFPVDLSEFNFPMLELPYTRTTNYIININIFLIQFFFNGLTFYINILLLKLSKTLYRCFFLGMSTFLFLFSIAFGDCLIFQIKHCFFLLGSLNLVGIVIVGFLGEFKNIPYIINDLKQNINKDKKIK